MLIAPVPPSRPRPDRPRTPHASEPPPHEPERPMPNGLIDAAALRPHPEGFALSLTIPWYRSLWLSSVGALRLAVDGTEVSQQDLAFELDGVRYRIDELPEQS